MVLIDWLILSVPILVLVGTVFYTQKYVKTVKDFLVAGRTGGRYLITSGNGMAGVGLITVVAVSQSYYHAGWAINWWHHGTVIIMTILALSGYVFYRYRETRALTMAQFFEIRYERKYRIFMGIVCFFAGVINYGIFPAIASNFFICFLDLPLTLCGIPTYPLLIFFFLGGACLISMIGGQIQNMVTDTVQALFCYVMCVVVCVLLLVIFDKAQFHEALCSQEAGKSFINPFDTAKISDFNVFFWLINVFFLITTYGSWQGNQGYNGSAITPHEAKMGNILSTWRTISLNLFNLLFALGGLIIVINAEFKEESAQIFAYLKESCNFAPAVIDQMMLPKALETILPIGFKGMVAAVLFFYMLSTDTTYIHSWGAIFVQDVVMPIYGKKLSPKVHLLMLRCSLAGVAIFAFLFSVFYQQSEYIQMFQMLTGMIFGAGAGIAIIGGLYWSRATKEGAWAGTIVGIVLALCSILLVDARMWAVVRELLLEVFPNNATLLAATDKCPINSAYLSLINCICAQITFIVVSLITCKKPFNMAKMLHRGEYKDEEAIKSESAEHIAWYKRLFLGFDEEFTLRDKIISLSVSCWVYGWGLAFLVITAWNVLGYLFPNYICMWQDDWWFEFFWINLILQAVLAPITAVWMTFGTFKDLRKMFVLLKNRTNNPEDDDDDGFVEKSE
ncbi:MAG: hypothetical protein IKD09_04585 [Lentisphaeria bacterium]|nr:hypothetical protein [Lentisphaeria bacterium]